MRIKTRGLFTFILTFILMLCTIACINNIKAEAASVKSIINSVPSSYTGFKTIKGNKYYFVRGKVTKGFKTINKKKYYFSDSGKMQKGLKTIKGNKYYFSKSGVMLTGKRTVNGNIYYFNKKSGKAAKNAFVSINNKKYYFTSSGKAKKGILNLNNKKFKNKRYYFNKNGVLKTGIITYNKVKYYFAPKGKKVTGFVTVNGNKYYVTSSGKVQLNFLTVNGKRYYFASNGVMRKGMQYINSNVYYFNTKGVMQTGFVKINSIQYYFNSSGIMLKGLNVIDGKIYYIENNGMIFYPTEKSGWEEVSNGDRYFYTANGVMLKNIVYKIDLNYYGFAADGRMCRGITQLNNNTYYFNLTTGAALIGWNVIGNDTYYFNAVGHMAYNFTVINNKVYYFSDVGILQNTGTIVYANKEYTQLEDGAIINFWLDTNGESYYFNEQGMMVTGVQVIDGITYYFDEKGVLYNDQVRRKGIDVSKWNGNIDWAKVKAAGVEFAMIRLGYEYTLDPYFKRNITGAQAAGIDVGVYIYSYAETVNEAKKEANFVIKTLKDYKLEYPVAFDIEDKVQSVLTNTKRTNITKTFCDMLQDAGYYTVIYSSKSWLENKFNTSELDKYDKWVAQWPYNDTAMNFSRNIEDKLCTYKAKYGMWQYTSSGSVGGIDGRVDLNYSYTNYTRFIKKFGYNNW